VFLEQDYLRSALREKLGAPDPPKTMEGETAARALFRARWLEDETDLAENRRILAALLRSDIEVRGDYNPAFFHQKFVLRDYRGGRALPTSALLSGSANFTVTDTHRNLNNVFVFRNAYICRQYETEVAQLRRGSFGRGLQGDEPRTYSLAGVPVKVLFAPDHTPELELMKQMLKVKAADPDTGLAGGSIAFAIFTFAGSSGIDDAMLALARGGVSVKGVLDRGQAMQGWAAPEWLRHERIELRLPPKDNLDFDVRKLHHKLTEIDRILNVSDPTTPGSDERVAITTKCVDRMYARKPPRAPPSTKSSTVSRARSLTRRALPGCATP
jgi:hypothetical protein